MSILYSQQISMFELFSKLNGAAISIITFITIILISAVVLSFINKSKYGNIRKDFLTGQKESGFKLPMLNKIMGAYRKSAEKNAEAINTQAIIEKEFASGLKSTITAERFIKNAVSLMIILGLLGTFYGLTLSIGDLVELLGNNDALSSSGMDGIVSGLVDTIRGMSVAFITSLFGILGAIILTVLKIFINPQKIREGLMIEIEEYLDNVIAFEYIDSSKNNTLETSVNNLFHGLSEQVNNLFEGLNNEIESSYNKVLDKSISGLTQVVNMMEKNQQSFNESLVNFDKTVDKFSENTTEFTEFNHHLRNNVDRMNVALSDFTEKIKSE